jgi:hypothetical protein
VKENQVQVLLPLLKVTGRSDRLLRDGASFESKSKSSLALQGREWRIKRLQLIVDNVLD